MKKKGKISSFDLLKVQKDYISRALGEIPGRKVLVLDNNTEAFLSQIFTVSQLWEYDVYLIENIEKMSDDKDQNSLNTVLIIRPTAQNIDKICCDISSYKFTDTFIYFVNEIEERFLEEMAIRDADSGKIQVVKEIYSDYFLINKKTFSLFPKSIVNGVKLKSIQESAISQLYSLLLSVRLNPYIYYSSNSTRCQSLATGLSMLMLEAKSRFGSEFVEKYDSVLLIVDRNDDKISPLRLPWHYQSMVYEYSQYSNGKVSLSKSSDEFDELQEIKNYNLTVAHDKFFEKHVTSDFGKIAKESTDALKNLQKINPNLKEMGTEDLGEIIDKLPELKRKKAEAVKHIDIVSDLTDRIKKYKLLQLRDIENLIFDHDNIEELFENVISLLKSDEYRNLDKERISLLFSLVHFKKDIFIEKILKEMESQNLNAESIEVIRRMYKSKAEIYENLPSNEQKNLSGFLSFLGMGDDQEEPYICKLVRNVIECKIEDSKILPADRRFQLKKRPGGIMVFIMGGMTLRESVALQEVNKESNRYNIISGGSHILNLKGFMDQLKEDIV